MRLFLCLVGNESVRAVGTAGTGIRTIDSKFQCSSSAPADQGWSALPAEKENRLMSKNKTPRTSNHSRPRGFYTNYSIKSLETVDNFGTSVVSWAAAICSTSIGTSICARNITTPIQAVLRPDQNVIDHIETSSDRVLPPA